MMRSVAKGLGFCAVVLACGVAACSGSGGGSTAPDSGLSPEGGGTPKFPASALFTLESADHALQIEVRTAPSQPLHTGPGGMVELRVTDRATGAPVDGLTVEFVCYMTVMQHKCSQVPPSVEPMGQGVYLVKEVDFGMPGACELQLTFAGARSTTAVSPGFTVTDPP